MPTNAITGYTSEQQAEIDRIKQQRAQSLFGGAANIAKGFLDPTDPLNYLGAFGKVGRGLFAITAGMRPQEAEATILGRVNPEMAARANQMLNSGASEGRILQETGLVKVPTKEGFTWGRQISDVGARIRPEVLSQIESQIQQVIKHTKQEPVKNIKVSDLLEHPELYKDYPEVGNISVVEVSPFQWDTLGFYNAAEKVLGTKKLNQYMNRPDEIEKQLKERASVLLHEAQHIIQDIEKWPRGGNPEEFLSKGTIKASDVIIKSKNDFTKSVDAFLLSKNIKPVFGSQSLLDNLLKYKEEGENAIKYTSKEVKEQIKQVAEIPEMEDYLSAYKRIKKAEDKVQFKKDEAMKKYRRLGGEAQSRAVQKMFEEGASAKNPIGGYYDVPTEELIYKDPFGSTIK